MNPIFSIIIPHKDIPDLLMRCLKYFCVGYVLNDNVQDVGLYNINTKGDMLNDIQIRDVFLAYKLVVTE
jgi:hypothetical protein